MRCLKSTSISTFVQSAKTCGIGTIQSFAASAPTISTARVATASDLISAIRASKIFVKIAGKEIIAKYARKSFVVIAMT